MGAVDLEAGLEYARRHALEALLVLREGEVVLEQYGEGLTAEKPHALYSGTKSFWGVLAVAAVEDGVLRLDELVATTVPAWKADPWKREVTLRQLLSLTSGIGFGGLGNTVPSYAKSLETELKAEPGTTFTYSGIPLQVFGAVLDVKLARRGLTPHAYLAQRILAPIGLTLGSWRTLKDGTRPLPTGAFATAQEWAKFGELLRNGGVAAGRTVLKASSLEECFTGSEANADYGLGIWLHPLAAPEIFYASGSGGQALYVVPSESLVVVHFGKGKSYKHETFLKRLFFGPPRGIVRRVQP